MGQLLTLFGGDAGGVGSYSFLAPLLTSTVLSRGTGTATYTRATTASVTDFEGLLKTAKSGETRFVGARRVENLLTYSQEISTTRGYATDSLSTLIINSAIAPDGTMTASTFSQISGTQYFYKSHIQVRSA
jgi:hypothetical protein